MTRSWGDQTSKVPAPLGCIKQNPMQDCPGNGRGWTCEGDAEAIRNGELCTVKCLTDGHRPKLEQVSCNDGQYNPSGPLCSGESRATEIALVGILVMAILLIGWQDGYPHQPTPSQSSV